MNTPDLTIYRRRLPHWRKQGAVYFVTWRLAKQQSGLCFGERSLLVASIKHFENQRYEIGAYVVMDDHVHVPLRPLEGFTLHGIVHSWKSFSAKQLVKEWGRAAPVWQREYFDRVVRNQEELSQKIQTSLVIH